MTSVLGQPHFRLPRSWVMTQTVGPLAAGGGDSQHHAHGQRLLDLGGAGEEIPEIPLVQRAEADGLGGVDDTAAAQCQQEVRAGPPDQVDALVYLAAAGVGLDAGELCKGGCPRPPGRR